MALYHFSVKRLGRGKGHSAVAAAAYRSGEKLQDDYYGEIRDYTKKKGVIKSFILLPEHVPKRLSDRATLWNEVERQEHRKDSQFAFSFDLALQNELTLEENEELVVRFTNENFVARGMICDVSIHDPPKGEGEERNLHFHILSPDRPMDMNGEWGAKRMHIPVVDENGEPVLDKKGRQKMDNPYTTDWGNKETLMEWRENWAKLVNEKFAQKGLDCRIDHRSNKDRGIDDVPQVHEGSAVRQMEKRCVVTYKGSWNKWVKQTVNLIRRLIDDIRLIVDCIREVREEIKRQESEPTLGTMIMEYWDHRNEVAKGYGHGMRKSQHKNMQLAAHMIASINGWKIADMASFESFVKEKESELTREKAELSRLRAELKDAKDMLTMIDFYQDYKGVSMEHQKIFFKSKKNVFYEEHKSEINRFRKAERILGEKGIEENDFKKARRKLGKQIETLEDSIKRKRYYISRGSITEDIKTLNQIKEAINFYMEKHRIVTAEANGTLTKKSLQMQEVPEIRQSQKKANALKEISETKQTPQQKQAVPVSTDQKQQRKRVSMKQRLNEKKEESKKLDQERQAEIDHNRIRQRGWGEQSL